MKLKKAMKLYPIEKRGNNYALGKKVIGPTGDDEWFRCDAIDSKKYTEKEAVAYLLEGYEGNIPKLPTMCFYNGKSTIEFNPKSAQKLIDILYSAGYRPTKEEK